MNKRGLSQIVIIGLVILLSIAAVIIVWNFVKPTLEDVGSSFDVGLISTSFTIPADKVKLDEGIKYVSFAVRRGAGEADVTGLKIILEDSEGNSAIFDEAALGELESRVIDVSYANTNLKDLDKISVAPVFVSGSDTLQGNVAGVFKFTKDGNYDLPGGTGLVAYWSFDEGSGLVAGDVSGNGHDGVLTNFPALPTWVVGKVGEALDFDGVDDYIDIADNTDFLINTFTISLWMKTSSVFQIAMLAESTTGQQQGYQLSLATDGRVFLDVGDGTDTWCATADCVYSTSNLNDGNWYHIVATYGDSNGNAEMYVNGIRESVTTLNGNIVHDPNDPFSIGRQAWQSGSGNYFDGEIDEVRIYNRVLDSEEVKALFEYSG